jgi:hypothetical protein
VVVGDTAPPLWSVDVEVAQRHEGEHAHEGDAGVEARSKHVVVLHPPGLVPAVDDVVEEEADESPHEEVDGARGEQPACAREDERQVDALEHAAARVGALQQPGGHRRQEADKEEVVHLPVVAQAAEHPQRADDAPDDGGVVEDVVAGARPGAAGGGELLHVADVPDRRQQPPRRREVHRGCRQRAGKLREKHGPRGYLHVVPQLEVRHERQRLAHADEAVRLEHHVGQWLPGVQVPDDELRDDIQPGLLNAADSIGNRRTEGSMQFPSIIFIYYPSTVQYSTVRLFSLTMLVVAEMTPMGRVKEKAMAQARRRPQ